MNSRIDSRADDYGLFQPRYIAFLETVSHLRSRMHRYCARMTGSAMDGEDVMQEALFEAYQKLEQFDNSRALKPWLFRIVHNRCIDFLRRSTIMPDDSSTGRNRPGSVSPRRQPASDPAEVTMASPRERAVWLDRAVGLWGAWCACECSIGLSDTP